MQHIFPTSRTPSQTQLASPWPKALQLPQVPKDLFEKVSAWIYIISRSTGASRPHHASRDTLQRHLTVHEKKVEVDTRPVHPGGRVKRACQRCSTSKLKCDGASPCKRCSAKQNVCSYGFTESPATAQTAFPHNQGTDGHDDALLPGQPRPETNLSVCGKSNPGWPRLNEGPSIDTPPTASEEDNVPADHMILSELRPPATDSVYESWAATSHAQPLVGHGTKGTSFEARGMTSTQSPGFQSGEAPAGATALELQSTELFSFGFPAADGSFWDDGLDLAALYHGTYADFSFPLTTSECELEHDITLDPSTDDLDIDLSPPPPPTFLDTRSSPDPQEGQTLKFEGFIRKAFKSRQQLYNNADQRTECDPGRAPQHHHGWHEKTSYAPLLGAFPMGLADDDEELWEPENLACVPTLTRGTHDFIVAQFKNLNTTDNHITQFATGRFPCRSACNAFMQLFFESFNPTLPMIHQGTFDPANEPWQLVLAVIATGCRFSRVAKAVQCGDLLQDLVRRAFNATVSLLALAPQNSNA